LAVGFKQINLRLVGSSELPQRTQGIGGFFDSLVLGHLWIPLVNWFVPIGVVGASFTINSS